MRKQNVVIATAVVRNVLHDNDVIELRNCLQLNCVQFVKVFGIANCSFINVLVANINNWITNQDSYCTEMQITTFVNY